MYKNVGLNAGDKIAINARSSSQWAEAFMSAVSGGYVSVQLFNGFTPSDTQVLVDHSDSRLLYTEKAIFSKMDFETMPQLLAAIDLKSGELLASRGDFASIYENRAGKSSSTVRNTIAGSGSSRFCCRLPAGAAA